MQTEFTLFNDGTIVANREEWRDIPNFPRYQASTFGRFRNRTTLKLLTGTTADNGYQHIGFTKDGHQITKMAHRIIAETFLEQPSAKHTDVNHKNKVRTDNRSSNLEWSTRSWNAKHAKTK